MLEIIDLHQNSRRRNTTGYSTNIRRPSAFSATICICRNGPSSWFSKAGTPAARAGPFWSSDGTDGSAGLCRPSHRRAQGRRRGQALPMAFLAQIARSG